MENTKQQLVSEFLTLMPKFRRTIDNAFTVEDKLSTILQLTALEQIQESSTIVVGELAQAIGLSASSVSQLSDRLSDAGYIRRKNDKNDRRIIQITLTKKGENHLKTLQKMVKEKIGAKISLIPEDDLREFVRIIKNFVDKQE